MKYSQPKKVKVLHTIYSLDMGGAERVVANYLRHHNRDAFQMSACALAREGVIAKDLQQEGYPIYILEKKPRFDRDLLRKLVQVIRSEKPDIIHTHNPSANHWSIMASMFSGRPRVIKTEHNIFFSGRVMRGYSFVNMILNRFNPRIICVSEEVRNSHLQKDPLSGDKYLTIYNGIPPLPPPLTEYSELRQSLGIDPSHTVVGTIGSLDEQKGHVFFLEMAKQILQGFPHTAFVIVGTGHLRSSLEEKARELGIARQVIFTGLRADALDILRTFDVFVLSSLWEGLPITILEAMAAGKPVAATDVGGNREAMAEGETGFLVPPKDPEALSNAVMNILQDQDLQEKMGKKGLLRFEQKFSVQHMIRATESLYLEVLK